MLTLRENPGFAGVFAQHSNVTISGIQGLIVFRVCPNTLSTKPNTFVLFGLVFGISSARPIG
jgi:hypothetical protein